MEGPECTYKLELESPNIFKNYCPACKSFGSLKEKVYEKYMILECNKCTMTYDLKNGNELIADGY